MARWCPVVRSGLAVLIALAALAGCSHAPSAPGPASPADTSAPVAAPDPQVKPYCDAVARVQAEQHSPQAGQGGVAAASAAARSQITQLVTTAPPEIAGDWRTLQGLTDRALGSLAATGGDPRRIDRAGLAAISQQSQPAVAHIKSVTQQRCGIAFQAAPTPAPAPPPAPAPETTTSSTTSTTKSRSSR